MPNFGSRCTTHRSSSLSHRHRYNYKTLTAQVTVVAVRYFKEASHIFEEIQASPRESPYSPKASWNIDLATNSPGGRSGKNGEGERNPFFP